MEHTAEGYWLVEAGTPEPAPSLRGAVDADVLVVGGGYTGLWSAWYAKQMEPGARVVVLEPNNSLSKRVSLIAAQFKATNGPLERRLLA